MSLDLAIIQVTSNLPDGHVRYKQIKNDIISNCIKTSDKKYVFVSPKDLPELQEKIEKHGGKFCKFDGWDVDKMSKFRLGLRNIDAEWIGIFDDDIYPDENWKENMSNFLKDKEPGQYGFRLTDAEGDRHQFGEDWMQFPNHKLMLQHRPLKYDIETGWVEDSPTAYVANCVVHRDVIKKVEPFGLFGKAPDVMWSLAIRQCGFKIGFNPKARAYHVGDRNDNRG